MKLQSTERRETFEKLKIHMCKYFTKVKKFKNNFRDFLTNLAQTGHGEVRAVHPQRHTRHRGFERDLASGGDAIFKRAENKVFCGPLLEDAAQNALVVQKRLWSRLQPTPDVLGKAAVSNGGEVLEKRELDSDELKIRGAIFSPQLHFLY